MAQARYDQAEPSSAAQPLLPPPQAGGLQVRPCSSLTSTLVIHVYSGGAPPSACSTLMPGHGQEPMNHKDIPYQLEVTLALKPSAEQPVELRIIPIFLN